MSDLVLVLATGDAVIIAMAKAALDAEGIRYVVQGDTVQDFIGLGRAPSGFNVATGPVRIHVAAENAARAREALEGLA